jgi:ectoine hydroxylase-related dioxygenase (phytanoyl-CoA dioxygenase family)
MNARPTDHCCFPSIRAHCDVDAEWTARASADFRSSGCLHVRDVWDPSDMAAMNAMLLERHARHLQGDAHPDALRVGAARVMLTVQVEGLFNSPALYANPTILRLMSSLLGPDLVIHNFGAVVSQPGAPAQHVHRDMSPWLFAQDEFPAELPPYAITVTVPLIGLDSHVGTTRMWPGTHRELSVVAQNATAAVDPVARPGDAVMMDYRLLHGGTANHSDAPRPLLYLVYSRPWFCDHRNFGQQPRLSMTDEAFAAVPQEHRRLFAGRTVPGTPG